MLKRYFNEFRKLMIELAELKENTKVCGASRGMQERIDELERRRDSFLEAIGKIENVSFRSVLIARYLNNKKWEDIADEFGFSEERHIYRLNRAAIQAAKEFIKIS